MSIIEINPKGLGDNMVGLLSQIGWTENSGSEPNKKIQMERIFIDADTDGRNGGGVFIWEVAIENGAKILHNKIHHREPVCNKVIEYLEE